MTVQIQILDPCEQTIVDKDTADIGWMFKEDLVSLVASGQGSLICN